MPQFIGLGTYLLNAHTTQPPLEVERTITLRSSTIQVLRVNLSFHDTPGNSALIKPHFFVSLYSQPYAYVKLKWEQGKSKKRPIPLVWEDIPIIMYRKALRAK